MVKDVTKVGQSFQGQAGVRWLTTGTQDIVEHAQNLHIDTGLTSPAAIEEWHADGAAALAVTEEDTPTRREYRREMVVRNRALVGDLKRLYGGCCQMSGEVPLNGMAGDITEAHHIHWLTRGGSDRRENVVIISPDWHAAVHAADAVFDWNDLAFLIGGRRWPLRLNRHLTAHIAKP
jgi:hypothetical protein